jgi:Uma2 family endonuclease
MTDLLLPPVSETLPRTVYAADNPINFAVWLRLGENLDTELIDGVMIPRMAAQYPHEWIFMWLATMLRAYTRHLNLGVVLGSRTAVKINEFNGRLPDVLFVRADNTAIIHRDAIYGIPDLVVELVSPNDRPSDLVPLETEYRALGVPEIVFVDPQKRQVRVISRHEDDYTAATLTSGRLAFASVPGFHIEVEWLFADAQPDEWTTVSELIREAQNR